MVSLNKEEDEKKDDDKDLSGLLVMARSVFR
jgi:hypothetical protein